MILLDKIIVIDDQITEKSTDGKRIIELLGSDYTIGFINTRDKLECLQNDIPNDLKLVLLDLDLSGKQMKVKAEDVLESLVRNKIKVIVLTKVPSSETIRKEQNEKWKELAYPLKLLNRGALGYLSKTEYDKRPIFFKNSIDSIAYNSHETYKLRLDCKLPKLQLLDINDNVIVSKEFSSGIRTSWKTAEVPEEAQEALLRIFYVMGKQDTTKIKLPDTYYEHLKSKSGKIRSKSLRFSDYANTFNNSVKEESEGLFAIRLLEGPGLGKRTGIYTANIHSVKLVNDEQGNDGKEEKPTPWKESVDNRFTEVQNRLTNIEKCLKQLLHQTNKD